MKAITSNIQIKKNATEMNFLNSIIKRFIFGFILFIILSLAFTNESLKYAHNSFFCVLMEPIINNINPHIFTEISPEAPKNQNAKWETTFMVYDKRKHGNKVKINKNRKQISASSGMYKSLRDIILMPFLLLSSLIFVSHLDIKRKLMKWLLGVLMFYLFMSLYISNRLEFILNNNELAVDSFWHLIITLFGFNGSIEPIYFYVLFIWAILILPATIGMLAKNEHLDK